MIEISAKICKHLNALNDQATTAATNTNVGIASQDEKILHSGL